MTPHVSSHSGLAALRPYLVLVAAVLLTHGNTLAGGFVWDDSLFTANQAYWAFDLKTIFLSLANSLEYQPVRDLTFLADIALWGERPFGFHLTNLLLFTLVVILVHRLAARLQSWCGSGEAAGDSEPFVPLGAALLFALHPLRSEVVAWVTQRNTLLATLFCLLSLLLFCRYLAGERGRGALAGSIAAFVLAVFSKAIVVILPLLLLFLAVFRKGGTRFPVPALVPFFAVSAAAAGLHVAIARQTTVISAAYGGSLAERVAVALQIPFFYLKKALLPTGLSAFYPDLFGRSLISWTVLLCGLVLLGAAAAAWLLRRRLPEFAIGYGWFLITLLPVSNLFATSPVVADRYLFLPAIGPCFTVAALLGRMGATGRWRRGIMVAGFLVLLALAVMTHDRNRVWRSDISLWGDTAVRSPEVAGVWYNLARAWHRTTRLGLALDAYLHVVRLDPSDRKALDNAAALFPADWSLAERRDLVADLAGQLPPPPAGLSLIGHTDRPWSRPEAAEALFLRLLEVDRDSPELRLALANLYLRVGAIDRAATLYTRVRGSGNGRGEAEFGLGRIAAASGDRGAAAELVAIARHKGGVPEPLLRLVSQ